MDKITLSRIVTGKNPYENIKEGSTVLIGESNTNTSGKYVSGVSGIPIEGKSEEYVTHWLGRDTSLTNAFKEFRAVSQAPVYLIRSSGNSAFATLTDEELKPKLKIFRTQAGTERNSGFCRIHSQAKKDGVGQETYLVLFEDFYTSPGVVKPERFYRLNITNMTLKEIEQAINREAYYSNDSLSIYAEAYSDEMASEVLICPQDCFFEGATEEHDILEDILSTLSNLKIKQIGMVDGVFNELALNEQCKYDLLFKFAEEKTKLSIPCVINIGVPPLYESKDMYSKLITFKDECSRDGNISEYINFIVAKLDVLNHISNGVSSYSALISALPLGESTTNKLVPNINRNIFTFSDEEIKILGNKGYVLLMKSYNKTTIDSSFEELRVHRGVNFLEGPVGYLSNMLIVQSLVWLLNDELAQFIGENVSLEEVTLAVTNVSKGFDYKNIIKKITLSVKENTNKLVKNYDITVDIVFYGEVESIDFTISAW